MANNETLTNLAHHQIMLLLKSLKSGNLLDDDRKKFLNDLGGILCDSNIQNDKDLYEKLNNVAVNFNSGDNIIAWFLKIIDQNTLSNENNRLEKQNLSKKSKDQETQIISDFYSLEQKRDMNSLADGLKNGTLQGSKVFKVIKEFDLHGKNFLDSDYVNIYLTKYNIKNKKEFGEVFNIPILPKSLFGPAIWIFTFFSRFYKTTYFDYKNQNKLEMITLKLLKILNKEKYQDLETKNLVGMSQSGEEKEVGVVIKLIDAKDIEEKDLNIAEKSEEAQKSFIEALAEAFVLDICDKTTMYNMMIHKNKYINIDYGLKYEKNHIGVVKKFCKALKEGKIEKAKEIFLSEIKNETKKKVVLLKNQALLTGNSNEKEIADRGRVYNFAKAILEKMPDLEFIKIFSDLLSREKVLKIQEVFASFYLNEPKYREMHCDVGACVGLIFDSIQECSMSKAKL